MDPAADHCHERHVLRQAQRLYDPKWREFAWERHRDEGLQAWQAGARPALRALLGLERMAAESAGHVPRMTCGRPEACDGFTRTLCRVETEPDWWVEVWLLRPDTPGPFPLSIHSHGHSARGHDIYAGVAQYSDLRGSDYTPKPDADVAVQAVQRGFLALAVNTRGFADNCFPDLNQRHGNRDCHCESIHALLAGRTTVGQRVWDLQRVLDVAVALDDADATRVLMMGNSGGGVATLFAAACDERITAAVPSCSFCSLVGENGLVHWCDCSIVPGIYRFGEASDVAGLIAARHLLLIHGRQDPLFPVREVERTVDAARCIFRDAGVEDRFEHRWGPEGHRFYGELMWPWVSDAVK